MLCCVHQGRPPVAADAVLHIAERWWGGWRSHRGGGISLCQTTPTLRLRRVKPREGDRKHATARTERTHSERAGEGNRDLMVLHARLATMAAVVIRTTRAAPSSADVLTTPVGVRDGRQRGKLPASENTSQTCKARCKPTLKPVSVGLPVSLSLPSLSPATQASRS